MGRNVLLAVLGVGLVCTANARGDVPPPLPPAKDSVQVKIEIDENAKGPRLVIPNGVFTAPRVRPKLRPNLEAPKDAPKGALEIEDPNGVAETDSPPQGRHHLLVAGVALSLAFASGGLWLRRRHGQGTIGLMLLAAAGASLTIGAAVWANAPPPPQVRPVKKVESFPSVFNEKASVEFTYGQEPVRLVLDKASFEKLKKGELTVPPATPPRPQ